jgi:hypothetical protein
MFSDVVGLCEKFCCLSFAEIVVCEYSQEAGSGSPDRIQLFSNVTTLQRVDSYLSQYVPRLIF